MSLLQLLATNPLCLFASLHQIILEVRPGSSWGGTVLSIGILFCVLRWPLAVSTRLPDRGAPSTPTPFKSTDTQPLALASHSIEAPNLLQALLHSGVPSRRRSRLREQALSC